LPENLIASHANRICPAFTDTCTKPLPTTSKLQDGFDMESPQIESDAAKYDCYGH
jgi:hypothetical protein